MTILYKCGKTKSNREEFIKKAIKIHGDKYDYSLVEYINARTKVKIICKEHGIFEQKPVSHIQNHGCLKCANILISIKSKKYRKENKTNCYQVAPIFNKNACQLFDKIMMEKNCHIQHAMNGGEYYIKELGYWVDGYDKENNIAYEYDERRHFKAGKLCEKDVKRQKEIENFLGCKFIRFNYKTMPLTQ